MSALLERMRARQQAKLDALNTPATAPATPATQTKPEQANRTDQREAQVGVTGNKLLTGDTIARAKTLLNSAEEQLRVDQEAGLFDIANASSDIPVAKFIRTFSELRQAQLAKTPELPRLQVETSNILREYEELTHLLTDAQIGVVVHAALEVAGIKQRTGSAKKNTAKEIEAKNASISLDDF